MFKLYLFLNLNSILLTYKRKLTIYQKTTVVFQKEAVTKQLDFNFFSRVLTKTKQKS